MSWLVDIIRSLFFLLDRLVYFLVDKVYTLFIDISNTNIFTDEIINAFLGKVYALVGIFMLFKVSFSVLTYIVNPDEFTDKNKGMGKIVVNILTSLVLIVGVPFIFSEAMTIQKIILKDDIIPKIFSTNKVFVSSQDPDQGSELALLTFQNFFNNKESNTVYWSLGEIFDTDINKKNGNEYVVEYDWLISTIVGVVLVLLLLSFCFDVALRSIKLGFLRMIAPIPILARIDPKKGGELFNKWTKTCVSTYLDLFMRLIAIYFALFIIKALKNNSAEIFSNAVTGQGIIEGGLITVFIILGSLMFAKQLPKLIEDLLGIKLSGNFSINPMKRLEDVPIAGKPLASATRFAGRTAGTIGGLGLAAVGSGIGLAAGGVDKLTGNKISGVRSTIGAEMANIRNGFGSDINDFLGNHQNLQNAVNRVAKDFHSISNDAQSTLYGAIGGIPGTGGLLTSTADRFDAQIKEYDSIIDNIDSMMKHANGEMIKHEELRFNDTNNSNISIGDFKVAKERLAALRNMDTSQMTSNQLNDHAKRINTLQTYIAKNEKLAEQAFVDAVSNGTYSDAEITARLDNIQRIVSSSSDATVRAINTSTGAGLKAGKDSVSDEKVRTQNSREFQAAQARKNAVPKSK